MTTAPPEPVVRSIILSPHLAEVSRGRNLLAEIASQAGFPDERVFDITVACSEAMANAIEHSPVKGEVQVRIILRPDRLEAEIQGPGEFQAPDRLGSLETRGLGLPLMAKLSDHLALFSGPGGETFVNLTFYRPGVKHPEHGVVGPSFVNLPIVEGINRVYAAVLRPTPKRDLGEVCLEVAEGLTESKFGFIGELGVTVTFMTSPSVTLAGMPAVSPMPRGTAVRRGTLRLKEFTVGC